MKRFVLIVVAALITVVGATAQSKAKLQTNEKKVSKTALAKVPERPVLKVTDLDSHAASQFNRQLPKAALKKQQSRSKQAEKGVRKQSRNRVAASVAQRRAAGIIIDQPAGTYHNMAYACSYFGYNWLSGFYAGEYSEALGEVVEGTDGCLYIHNMLTELSTPEGYWVRAEKVSGQADTYVIHEQPIYVEDYYGTFYVYSIMKVMLDETSGNVAPARNTDIKITWKNGQLRTVAEFNPPTRTTSVISAIDDGDYWSGAANWNVTMTPMTDVAITELPAGVEPQIMVMKYISGYQVVESEDGESSTMEPVVEAHKAKLAVNGSDIYLQYYPAIDSWIKGTISGNKATFANFQYLGPDFSYAQQAYFVGGDADDNFPENVVFDYDPATNKLSNSNMFIYANGGKSKLYYLDVYENPEIYEFVEVAATPKPVDASTMYGLNYDRSYGYGFLDFSISCFDVNDNYIDTDKLYYKVYVGDDENNSVFTFTPEEYRSLTAPTTEIPYNFFTDEFWCNDDLHEFITFVNQAKNLGIQVIYKGGGEEHASEITWNWDNNGAVGFESVFPSVENPVVNSVLNSGEMALNLGEVYYPFGSERGATESYDVAMKISDDWNSGAKLSGKKVAGVSVPFFDVEGISNAKVWLSTSIELDADGHFTPNGPCKSFTIADNGFTTVRFDEPYEIPEDGLYIGYSFTASEKAVEPIALTGYTNVGGFMVHSDKVYRLGWADMTGAEGDLGLEAILVGGDTDAAEVPAIKDVYTKVGEASKTLIKVANYGCNDLNSIAYDYKVLGYDVEADLPVELTGKGELTDLSLPRVFGGYKTFTIDIPAIDKIYDYVFYTDVTKANDKDNAIEDSEAQCNVFVMNFLPKKRPLMEEYTGTWCGWCPRGIVGLEKMNELYPEDFVALSYHDDDPMQVTTDVPRDDNSFPAAYLDRQVNVDPYYGLERNGFGIDKAWLQRSQEFGVADIDVEASWSEDLKTINVKSTTTFVRSEESANYAISYAVVADGLTGTSDDWAQTNNYSGGAAGFPQYMEKFVNGGSYVSGLVYNDVLVASSDYEGVEGSVPESVVGGTPYTHEFSFNAADIVNIYGTPVIQDKNKVRVVAMLVSWGNVLNANKCKVTVGGSGIRDLNAGADRVVKTEYFDLSGRKVLLPANGVYIKSQQLKNGETVTQKVVVK